MNMLTKAEVFEELRRRGAGLAIVEFSGGGDEGGADSVRLYREATAEAIDCDKPLEELPTYPNWQQGPVHDVENALIAALVDPMENEYGSFAGDFHVQGTIAWDVAKETCIMSGEVSHEEWDSFEKEV
jgi:hypothetical protein